jgi:hydroxymethylpyrimidine pyrophosphatase-like HAD family hydrolase/fructoselysine-6-P-deglycase FrlB-like protein
MGKPYSSELKKLSDTYQWALNEPIDLLESFIESSFDLPLLAIGSGGSLTAASMAALLHEKTGMISKSITPLDLLASNISLNKTSVLLLTAGGRNSDILASFKYAVTEEPRQLMTICLRKESPLANLAKGYRYVKSLEFDIPSKKDGFLATNSLVALFVILCRAYRDAGLFDFAFSHDIFSGGITNEEPINLTALRNRRVWFVLYGGWGFPAALDIESKFTEAALGNIHLADYRNFAHGRHNWLAQCPDDTGMIYLVTPEEEEIADETIKLIPNDIPLIRICTSRRGPIGTLELLIKVLYLTKIAGDARNIDPGRPNVPEFGRQIYHLNIRSKYIKRGLSEILRKEELIAIRRKNTNFIIEDSEIIAIWRGAYRKFINTLNTTSFGAVVFDYDGTLCDSTERFYGPPTDIAEKLIYLLQRKIPIGIATGRGKSVRKEMQERIPNEYWDRILIGYYNGSDIALLSDLNHPRRDIPIDPLLNEISNTLTDNEILKHLVTECEIRPKQATILSKKLHNFREIREMIINSLPASMISKIKIVESSHSIDLILSDVSKIDLVSEIETMAENLGRPKKAVCIGDKGEWPGNDYELLSTPYSLSVDYVSSDLNSCWNLAPAGCRGVQATLNYINSFVANGNSFHINTALFGGK